MVTASERQISGSTRTKAQSPGEPLYTFMLCEKSVVNVLPNDQGLPGWRRRAGRVQGSHHRSGAIVEQPSRLRLKFLGVSATTRQRRSRGSPKIQVWVKRLEGLGAGINGIGEGAAKLWVNPGTDEAAAKAKIEQMMVPKPGERVNPLRDSYRALMKEVEKQAAE